MKAAILKALIVLVPSYVAAFLTDKMVYVVPTLAAAGFLAASVDLSRSAAVNRVDEDGTDPDDDADADVDDTGPSLEAEASDS